MYTYVVNDTDTNLGAAIVDKQYVIKECKLQLFDGNTYIVLSMEEMKMLIAKIQTELLEVFNKHKIRKSCNNKEATFILSKTKTNNNPTFLYYFEIFEKSNCRKANCSRIPLDSYARIYICMTNPIPF